MQIMPRGGASYNRDDWMESVTWLTLECQSNRWKIRKIETLEALARRKGSFLKINRSKETVTYTKYEKGLMSLEILLGRLEHDVLNKDTKTNPKHFLCFRIKNYKCFYKLWQQKLQIIIKILLRSLLSNKKGVGRKTR